MFKIKTQSLLEEAYCLLREIENCTLEAQIQLANKLIVKLGGMVV